MPGTHTDTWLAGLTWVLTLLSLVGLLAVGARLVARRLLVASHGAPQRVQRSERAYPTVPASEQTGENLRPGETAAQRSGRLRESV